MAAEKRFVIFASEDATAEMVDKEKLKQEPAFFVKQRNEGDWGLERSLPVTAIYSCFTMLAGDFTQVAVCEYITLSLYIIPPFVNPDMTGVNLDMTAILAQKMGFSFTILPFKNGFHPNPNEGVIGSVRA